MRDKRKSWMILSENKFTSTLILLLANLKRILTGKRLSFLRNPNLPTDPHRLNKILYDLNTVFEVLSWNSKDGLREMGNNSYTERRLIYVCQKMTR